MSLKGPIIKFCQTLLEGKRSFHFMIIIMGSLLFKNLWQHFKIIQHKCVFSGPVSNAVGRKQATSGRGLFYTDFFKKKS